MLACRVAVLAGVALASATAAAGDRQVGFAVLADSEADSRRGDRAIEAVRPDLARHGLASIPAGDVRDALEAPLPPGSSSAGAVARARKQLDTARESYSRFEYERALADLEAVDRLLLAREPSPQLIEVLVQRHLLAGLIHEGRRRPAEARRSFRLVRHLDPSRRSLDAAEYRPQVVALFAQAIRDDGRRASLLISTTPAGASVWLDGRPAGEAPLQLQLSPGYHWIVAGAPGHRPHGAILDADPARSEPAEQLSLDPRSPAERARELRRDLGAAAIDRERRAAARELARIAGADVLVLVRARGARVEATVFDARRGALSAWLAMPSERFDRQLAAAGAPYLSPSQAAGGEAQGMLAGGAEASASAPSWYSTWWGRTILIAGGLALGSAAVFALTSGGDPSYSVGDFCFAGRDC